MNRFLIVFILLITVVGCANNEKPVSIDLPYYTSSDLTPRWMKSPADTVHRIGAFSLTDQNGQSFTPDQLKGKVYAANFFFTTCPGVCRLMTKELHAFQEAFEEDSHVRMVSHTVMPWVDTVAQLKHFERTRDINGEFWHLLTGTKSEIYELARASYFADEGFGKSVTKPSEFLHTENVMLIDADGHIRGVYNGTLAVDIRRLIEDTRQLLGDSNLR